jgi:2-dehydro-3-deoxygluconokinase
VKGVRFVAVGECMVELFSEDPVPVERSERFRSSFGGDAMQAALAASNLGTRSAVATVAGDDPFAGSLLEWLDGSGISTDLILKRPGFTGLYMISIDPKGERSFAYYRKGSAASTLGPDDVAWAEPPDAVLVSGITQAISESSRAAALDAARLTREEGGTVVYDFNYRPRLWGDDPSAARQAFEEILPFIDVLRATAPEETSILADEADPIDAARALSALGVPTVLLGCGAEGAVLASRGEIERVPAPPVRCIDTTGAGDALTGAFVHGLLAGSSPSAAARVAVAAGSLAVTRRGGASSMPPGDEVRATVERMRAPV